MAAFSFHRLSKTYQGGATFTGVILAGLGALAATVSIMSMINGAQDQALAVHGSVQAQSRAWLASEAIKRYIGSLSTSDLTALTGNIALTGLNGTSAKVISNTSSPTGGRRLVVLTTVQGSVANTNVQSVYDVTPGASSSPGSPVTLPSTGILLNGNTNLSGGVFMSGSGGTPAVVYVNGSININSSQVSGIGTICSTMDMNLNSGIVIPNVCTNGNLTMTGAATISGNANIKGNVYLNSAGSIGTLTTNGSVNLNAGSINLLYSKGNVMVTDGGAYVTTLNTEGSVSWKTAVPNATTINANGSVLFSGQNTASNINAFGNVTLAPYATVGTIKSQASVNIDGSWGTQALNVFTKGGLRVNSAGGTVGGGKYGGTLTTYTGYTDSWTNYNSTNKTNDYQKAVKQTGYVPPGMTTIAVPALSTFTTTATTIDVAPLLTTANYVWSVDGSNRMQVTISNVNGIPNGTYYIGKYKVSGVDTFDYYCNTINASGYCTSPASPTRRVLAGYSPQNEAMTYNATTSTWTFAGTSMPPGIMFFYGNLLLSVGTFYNTFLVTGNIDTSSGYIVDTAPNWGGFGPVCQNATSGVYMPATEFNGLYPKQLCDMTNSKYLPNATGNITYMAGTYQNGIFTGGTVISGAGNTTYGTILAGDKYTAQGSSTITGTVYSAGQGTSSAGNVLTGDTTINQTNTPSTFSSVTIPCMGTTCGSGSSSSVIKNYWSRYQ